MEGSWKNSELSWGPMLITDPTSVGDKANNWKQRESHIRQEIYKREGI